MMSLIGPIFSVRGNCPMYKTLLSHIGYHKKASVIAALAIMTEVLIEVQIPFFMARIIDVGIPSNDLRQILIPASILVVCALASMSCGITSGLFAARAATGFAANLRSALFTKIQSFSFTNIDRFSPSGLITHLTTDVTNVQTAWQLMIRILVRSPFMIICCFIQACRINAGFAFVLLGAIFLLASGMAALMISTRPIFRRGLKLYDTLNLIVQENVRGIRVVKSFVREDREMEKFDRTSADIYSNFVKAEKVFSLTGPLMQFMISFTLLGLLTLSARMIVRGEMTTGELTSMITYNMLILNAILLTSMSLLQVVIAGASVQRIVKVLDEESTISSPTCPLYEVSDGSIEFKDVSFIYTTESESIPLDSVNVRIESGQTIGIVGDTGSSKTTLVQLIPRLYDVESGSVLVGDHDVRDYDLETLRDKVAIVLQKNVLFAGSILDNLRWGNPDASEQDCVRACRLAQADDFIRAMPKGYHTPIEQGGANVSGGQKQRLCIARALLKRPKILILDDSTSAVDMATESALLHAFGKEIGEITKIIIAQRVNSIIDSDAIIVMHQGRVHGFGTHEHLYAHNKIYRQVFDTQNPR